MARDAFYGVVGVSTAFITDRWWMLAAALVAVGGLVVATVTRLGWLLIAAGLVVLVYGVIRGTERNE